MIRSCYIFIYIYIIVILFSNTLNPGILKFMWEIPYMESKLRPLAPIGIYRDFIVLYKVIWIHIGSIRIHMGPYGPKWAQSGPKVGPKWAQSGPKVGPKWAQSGPKWAQVGPK